MERQKPQLLCLQGAPLQTGSKEVTFAALAATYGLANEVTNLFLESPMESLEDFRYYFADEKEIDEFMTPAWKPEAETPLEPEEEPELTSEPMGDRRHQATQISRVKGGKCGTALIVKAKTAKAARQFPPTGLQISSDMPTKACKTR